MLIPNTASNKTINLTVKANIIAVVTFLPVSLDIFIASPTLLISSLIKTASLASIVASLPIPPTDIPTSDVLITGASLIPSPINNTFPSFLYSFTFSTLSNGNISPKNFLMPIFLDTSSTILLLSPDRTIISLLITSFKEVIFLLVSLILSDITR